jgi:hypothetical protein
MDICRRKFGACILAGLASRAIALPPRPKLLVLLVLEHLRPDYLDAVWGQVGPGGLRRIVEGGAFFPDCRHLASSFSSTTLATLATGAWPAQHGIVADTWYDRASRKPVRASDEALLATTLTAQVASAPGTRAFVISLNPSEGSLVSGSSGARAYWMDDDGRFTSRGQLPPWVPDYNRARPPLEDLHDKPWVAMGANPKGPALRTLKFDPAHSQEFLSLYRASPFAQAAQFEFLHEMLLRERLGQTDTLDFVCLVASSSSLLGYETGARSPLMLQMTLQLDRQLELLLSQLDQVLGARTYDLVLAGAHGGPPEPATELRPRMAVNGEFLAQTIQQGLMASGSGRLEKYLYPFLYLDTRGVLSPEPARQVAGRAALEQPAVSAYYTAGGECSVHDDWERRFRNSFHPRRSGDVMLSYLPEYVEDYNQGHGISYGSLYNYDIRTPLCFYGPQFRAAVFEASVEAVDLAPTLARALGVAPPSSSSGRVLGEAFAGG